MTLRNPRPPRTRAHINTDRELRRAIAELRCVGTGAAIPTMSDVIRKAVFDARDRLPGRRRQQALAPSHPLTTAAI